MLIFSLTSPHDEVVSPIDFFIGRKAVSLNCKCKLTGSLYLLTVNSFMNRILHVGYRWKAIILEVVVGKEVYTKNQ